MDSAMSPAGIFKTKASFDVLYDTVDGVQKNPHVGKPGFSLGGLEFNFTTRNTNGGELCGAFVELSEASKNDLAPGYEISIKRFDMKFTVIKNSGTTDWSLNPPVSLSDGAARLFFVNSIQHIEAQISMEFRNVYSAYPLEFVDAEVAKEKHSDCKITLKDDENKEVFVHKAILAFRSLFFEKLFFGDFKEKDEEDVKLSNVNQTDFLDYVCRVYPPPNRPFVFKRLDTLLALADRFLNTTLVSAIENFLLEKTHNTSEEKRQMLIWADKYNMKTLFSEILNDMDKAELKGFDPVARVNFKKENHDLFVAHVLGMW